MPNGKGDVEADLLPDDQAVLRMFREYLMTPGKMLCFYGHDLERYGSSLAGLSVRGLLKSERFFGGYSLTIKGYEVMLQI